MGSWGFRVVIQNSSYALGARQQHVDGAGREQGGERSRAWDQEAAKWVISSTYHPFLSGLRPAMNDEEDRGIL